MVQRFVLLQRRTVFILVHQHIRFCQDLGIGAVNAAIGMMMGYQPADTVHIFLFKSQFFQHGTGFIRSQFLLDLAIVPAKPSLSFMDADIMHISSCFQKEKGLLIESFLPADLGSKSMNLQEMVNPPGIPFVISNHSFA